jgi:hypothetical protein
VVDALRLSFGVIFIAELGDKSQPRRPVDLARRPRRRDNRVSDDP